LIVVLGAPLALRRALGSGAHAGFAPTLQVAVAILAVPWRSEMRFLARTALLILAQLRKYSGVPAPSYCGALISIAADLHYSVLAVRPSPLLANRLGTRKKRSVCVLLEAVDPNVSIETCRG
jgi:hypothetical protein